MFVFFLERFASHNVLDSNPESKTVKRNSGQVSSPHFSDKEYYPPPAEGSR